MCGTGDLEQMMKLRADDMTLPPPSKRNSRRADCFGTLRVKVTPENPASTRLMRSAPHQRNFKVDPLARRMVTDFKIQTPRLNNAVSPGLASPRAPKSLPSKRVCCLLDTVEEEENENFEVLPAKNVHARNHQ